MKKSKIIIPAAAILALSVGASVTGTVAWFSASNRANVTASNLAVVNAQGALTATNATGIGTSKDSGGNIVLSYLQDASHDFESKETFVAKFDNDGTKVIGARKVLTDGSRTLSTTAGEKTVYYVNSWTTTFSSTSVIDQYLFFDNHIAKSFITDGADDTTVYKSLRVSMVCGSRSFLWAPYTDLDTFYYLKEEVSLETEKQYDVKTTINTKEIYGESVTEYAKLAEQPNINEGDTVSSANKLLLATDLSSKKNAEVYITVWFEGLDPACVASDKVNTGINTVSTLISNAISKTLTLSYYAVASDTLTITA